MADPGSTTTAPEINRGLAGLIVAETRLSMVDGTNGRLNYLGYSIADLAQHAQFEEVLYLLWYGELPTRSELDELNGKLTGARKLSTSVMNVIKALPKSGDPIDAMRAGVTAMAMEDPTCHDLSHDAVREKSIRLAGAMPTMLAAYSRLRKDEQPLDPDPSLNTAADFLRMVHGKRQSKTFEDAMNAYLVCVCEHSMNASTFSARVTISTISDIYAAISTALGTLKGDAHGGANQKSMEMLLEIGSPDNADNYVEESLRTHRRIMGLGHRIYKTRDPRVNQLMGHSAKLAEETGNATWHNLAQRLEEITATNQFFLDRKLFPNVEFYSAPLLYMLGMTTDMMPGAFAISRVGGWSAQVLEQLEDNHLIRPSALYTGPESQTYVPIDQRG
jgi:citrate synthase